MSRRFQAEQTQADGQRERETERQRDRQTDMKMLIVAFFFCNFTNAPEKPVCWFYARKLARFAVGMTQNT